jgi:hypothetical protein
MMSIIMPTLWKGEFYKNMLPIFDAHPLVGEIVIINNNATETDYVTIKKLTKAVVHTPTENIYVNPAWNYGVKVSKYDVVCLYSDDVLFDIDCLEQVYRTCTPDNGLVGFSIETISEKKSDLESLKKELLPWQTLGVSPTPYMHYRYGICMFMHKSAYHEIPSEYKIYYGDTYLFDQNVLAAKQNYKIDGCVVATKMKTTSNNFSEIVKQDEEHFNKNNPTDELINQLIKELEKES